MNELMPDAVVEEELRTFDIGYVKSLRQECAKYRIRLRETMDMYETRLASIEAAIAKMSEAIAVFTGSAPQTSSVSPETAGSASADTTAPATPVQSGSVPQAQATAAPVSTPQTPTVPEIPSVGVPAASTVPAGEVGIADIKDDPIARDKLRDMYREMLRSGK